jgi:tRNA threonylcarbamoyladenosine biosynthesis protein TsaB
LILLAIDTATEACSVALWNDGAILERYEVAGREHSTKLPKMVPALLAEAGIAMSQIDGLVAGIGPGSFAGVRIGLSYLKGLALGLDRPALGVSSLAMLAQRALCLRPDALAVAAIDARMDEVYLGRYRLEKGIAVPVSDDAVLPPARVEPAGNDQPWVAIGSGWAAYREALLGRFATAPEQLDGDALPHAADAFALAAPAFVRGGAKPAAVLVPAYLRNRVALTQAEQRQGLKLR